MGRHLYRPVSLTPFYLIRQPAIWIIPSLSGGPLYKVWAAPFYGQGISLTQAHMTSLVWGVVRTIFKVFVMTRLEPETSLSRSRCATTEPNMIGQSKQFRESGQIFSVNELRWSVGDKLLCLHLQCVLLWCQKNLVKLRFDICLTNLRQS